jgi:hypothetical protein
MATVEQHPEAILPDESIRVRQWRIHQFFELGFPLSDAKRLAVTGADVAQARRLVRRGCPIPIAYRIVR